jgi:microcystin-dependent protein
MPGINVAVGAASTSGDTAPVPTGCFFPFAGSTSPNGWLFCNGAAISRTTYASLFAVIGTAYGVGDGSTTFNVPNMARAVPVGAGGTGTGVLGNTVGSIGGEETHTLSVAEVPPLSFSGETGGESAAHSHTFQLTQNDANDSAGPPALGGNTGGNNSTDTTSGPSNDHAHAYSGTTSGGGGAHNNMQPSVVCNYIIKF